MQQDFRVRPAVKARACGGQLGCERAKVVDGAVEDDPEGSVRRHHRLPPRIAEVEDGEASMAEHHAGPALDALAVGPPPGQCAGHALDRLQRRGRVLRPDYAGDPAHSLADCFVRPPSHRDLRGHRLGITQSRCRMIEYQRSFRPRKTKWELNQGCPAPPRLTKIRYTKLRASCAFAHTTSPRRLSLVVVVSTIWRLTPPK